VSIVAEPSVAPPALAESRVNEFRKLALGAVLFSFGMSLQGALFMNFALDELRIAPSRLGMLEAIRETGGFLTAFSGAVSMRLAEPLAAAGCLILLAVGVGGYSIARRIEHIALASFTWSVGFHLFHPLQQSMNLALVAAGAEGRQLGRLQSYSSFATLLALAFVFTLGRGATFRDLFLLAALSLFAGACVVATIRRDLGHPEKPRLVWRPEAYGLYYRLAFLEGCRKQFFITFAPMVLIRTFGFDREHMAKLMFVNALLTLALAPRFGRLIDRLGERRVLTVNYLCILLAFVGYATIRDPRALSVLFCVDSVLFFFAGALTTYVKKLAVPEEVMPTLAMGVSVNHIAAVLIPLVGGFFWERFDYPLLFIGGTVFAAASVVSVQQMSGKGRRGLRIED